MDLNEAMNAATQDPPPTAIDVDRLIAGEHRRALRLRALTGVTLIAVLVAGVAMAPQLLARPPVGLARPGASPSTCIIASPSPVDGSPMASGTYTADPTADGSPISTETAQPPTSDPMGTTSPISTETAGPPASDPMGTTSPSPSVDVPPICGEQPVHVDGCHVTTVPVVTQGPEPTASPGTDERLTEPCEAAIARLGDVINQLLTRAGIPVGGAPDPVMVTKYGFPVQSGYLAWADLGSRARLRIDLVTTDATIAADRDAFADKYCRAGCERKTREGSLVLKMSAIEVWSLHPDGTVIRLTLMSSASTNEVSEQQLMDLAAAPGLTLFP